jgi:UDP-N-acetylmuramate dehydrogenase
VSGGSNLLVGDQGFPGLVVLVATQGITVTRHSDTVGLSVAAGQSWDRLVAWTVDQGWGGLEALSGIPGLVGAAPVQNIGAYGAEVASAIAAVTAWDRHTGQVARLGPAECRFGYRTSLFKQQPGRWVVLRVELTLRAEAPRAPAAYAELARRLGVEVGGLAPTSQVRQAVLDLRRGKGMVLDPADHDTWSAGSFFTNPIIEPAQAAGLPADAPRFPQPGGAIKTSAAWLIERAGFHKGYGPGPARLSTKHVLALTNRGGATAADLMDLACQVRDGVRQTYGIALVPEPVLVGLDLDRWPASGHRPTEGTR